MTGDDEFYPEKEEPDYGECCKNDGRPAVKGSQFCQYHREQFEMDITILPTPTQAPLEELFNPSTSEPTDFVIDLGDLPSSGEARLRLATDVLKAVNVVVDEMDGDFDPMAVREYTDQLKVMLDEGISLFNIMVGRWALSKTYNIGERVYFQYYGLTHIGEIKTIGKSEILISFEHSNKNKKGEPEHIETWRRKDQVKKP